MTVTNTQLANVIINLNSSLRGSIINSLAWTSGSRILNEMKNYTRIKNAEVKTGRRKMNIDGGYETDAIQINLEVLGAAFNCFCDQMSVDPMDTIESIVAASANPWTKAVSEEVVAMRAKLGQQSEAQVRAKMQSDAEIDAARRFEQNKLAIGEIDTILAMSPDADMEDIDCVEYAACVEKTVAKYRSRVAAGKVWDQADMVLALDDIDTLTKLGLAV